MLHFAMLFFVQIIVTSYHATGPCRQDFCHRVTNIGEIHYHVENKTNGGKQIEFSAESNQFEKKIESGNK